MALPLKREPMDEPARLRLLRRLDVLRGMVAAGEPLGILDTVEQSGGRRVGTAQLSYDADAYAKRWLAQLPGC